jgi:hypothetical protein
VPLDVAIDLKDLERTERGSIVGRVWLVLDDYTFPERGWSDLVVVVLCWWIEQLLQVESEDGATMTLLFMDGPYSVHLRAPSEDDVWSVSLLRDRGPLTGKPEAAGFAQREQFAARVLSVAREVVATCQRKGWSDDHEVLKLARLADALATRVPTGRSVDR